MISEKSIEAFRFAWQNNSFAIGVSIGLVPITVDSESLSQLLGAADAACYTAKDKGRNRVQVYEASDTELAVRKGEMQWLPRISQALEENRFLLYYQEIVSISAGKGSDVVQYEVLLRMRDSDARHALHEHD